MNSIKEPVTETSIETIGAELRLRWGGSKGSAGVWEGVAEEPRDAAVTEVRQSPIQRPETSSGPGNRHPARANQTSSGARTRGNIEEGQQATGGGHQDHRSTIGKQEVAKNKTWVRLMTDNVGVFNITVYKKVDVSINIHRPVEAFPQA